METAARSDNSGNLSPFAAEKLRTAEGYACAMVPFEATKPIGQTGVRFGTAYRTSMALPRGSKEIKVVMVHYDEKGNVLQFGVSSQADGTHGERMIDRQPWLSELSYDVQTQTVSNFFYECFRGASGISGCHPE